MPKFTKSEAHSLSTYVAQFSQVFQREVAEVLAGQFRGCRPAEVTDLIGQLSLLERSLEVRTGPVEVHDAHARLLKRVLIDQRRELAQAIDVPLQKAVEPQLIRMLKRELQLFDHLMSAPWFEGAQALSVPRLTDYLSIRHAEAAAREPAVLRPREYDEKFHILEAPSLVLPDLGYYRRRCSFRGVSVAVAYLDIDDFKAYNTRHGEPRVDIDLLAPFMEALEAHVFARGHAYRFGGDEYLLLLPNLDGPAALDFLGALQARIARAPYRGMKPPPSVSIGLCVVDVDCVLTDREVLGRANAAKNHAKVTAKGSIAGFTGVLFRDADLGLLRERPLSEDP